MGGYEVFKSFYDEQQAIALQQFLQSRGIDAVIVRNRPVVDKVLTGDGLEKDIFIKIDPDNFDHANRIIDEQIEQNLSQIDPDYYLFSFADDELFEIVQKADEWSNQDVVLARRILKDRGYDLSEKQVKDIRSTRIRELAVQEEDSPWWTYIGFLAAFSMPIIGLIMGLSILQSRKLLPDGRKIPTYNPRARSRGRGLIILSSVTLTIWLVLIATGHIQYRDNGVHFR